MPTDQNNFSSATEFKEIMEEGKGGLLKSWIKKVVPSGIKEMLSFVRRANP